MQFRIFEGAVYAFSPNRSFALDTNGYDDPNQWTWHELSAEMRWRVERGIMQSSPHALAGNTTAPTVGPAGSQTPQSREAVVDSPREVRGDEQ